MVANRWFPSSRLCRFCGYINSELKFSDRERTCDCGAIHDRDLNAAINLKNLIVWVVRSERAERQNACGEDIRSTVASLAASMKQESGIESLGRFEKIGIEQ